MCIHFVSRALTGHGYQNATDMSIQPAQGLRPPSLKVPGVSDTAKTSKCESRLITNGKLKTAISEQLVSVMVCTVRTCTCMPVIDTYM